MSNRNRNIFVASITVLMASWFGVFSVPSATAASKAKTTKAPAKPAKSSVAGFCKATKAWAAWETATLDTSGHLNEKWIIDTLSYVKPIYAAAPKEIKDPVYFTVLNLVSSRRTIVESVVGKLDMPTSVADMIDTGKRFAGDDKEFIRDRDKFAAYSIAKCKVDWTLPFKAVGTN